MKRKTTAVKKAVKPAVKKATPKRKAKPAATKSKAFVPPTFAEKSKAIWNKSKTYIGLKQLQALPMKLGAYNKFRGWSIPGSEDPTRAGYVVQYASGYISWSTKADFDASYQATNQMDFSAALFVMKAGAKIARKGWNGKKMWIILVPGTAKVKTKRGSPYAKAGVAETAIGSHIDMMTAQGIMQPGWLASQPDMLATDWAIVQ